MNTEQKVAYVFAQAVSALAEIEGMKAFNQMREVLGQQIGYDDTSFFAVIDKYGLDHDNLIALFSEEN